jgi:hypothetical protein|tara:strand:- start:191 stop:367 length:177 start_codon:yes stop_codon:yes gene_type:complete
MAKDDKKVEIQQEPINMEDQLKAIEAQIAELRGTYNYIMSLKEQGFKVIPPVQNKVES